MPTIIKKGNSPNTVRKKVEKYQKSKRKSEIEKLCGSISLPEDPLTLQRKWRDEWK